MEMMRSECCVALSYAESLRWGGAAGRVQLSQGEAYRGAASGRMVRRVVVRVSNATVATAELAVSFGGVGVCFSLV